MRELIATIQRNLSTGKYPNEQAIRENIFRPLLRELGWPDYDPEIVRCEYCTEGALRVDYALCPDGRNPLYFVEVKSAGKINDSGVRQLFEYAFHRGAALALLTDGRQWDVYLPSGAGAYEERLVYRLDLIERSPEEAEQQLRRYMAFDRVISGEALKAAQDDYQGVFRMKKAGTTIPEAWRELLSEADDLHSIVLDAVSEKVQNICGFRPTSDQVRTYLGGLVELDTAVRPEPRPVAPRVVVSGQSMSATLPPSGEAPVFTSKNRRQPGLLARGYPLPGGRFRVLKGSTSKSVVEQSLSDGEREFRDNLIRLGKLRPNGNDLMVFVEDVMFESSSAAASVVNTCSRSGPDSWILENGSMTLGQWLHRV